MMPRNSTAPQTNGALTVKRKDGQIWSHIRQKWLVETPEERVRQEYLCTLVNEYEYGLNQIDEELKVVGRGSGNARADFVIWHTPQDKADGKTALIVVECKADNVTIDQRTYEQGANYAQYERAKFFVTHNNRETKYWHVDLERRAPNFAEIENIPHADASEDEVNKLLSRLKTFKEDEFAALLHQCHNVIRNREKKDPAAAFDEIAKILFLKVNTERRLRAGRSRTNLFTAEFLDEQRQIHNDPINVLFRQTKEDYKTDKIFDADEEINLKFNTAREIVRLLERYNLSDTSEDIKGIAFERFLGRTFRGEIGQFFTPRTIVEFMIRMVEPKEGDVICDPASGSGGFLIRFFEIVREQILADVDRQYKEYREEIEGQNLSEAKKAELLRDKFDELQKSIKPDRKGSRLWKLANRCIYGTDANDRMARTSKMNMIMHGDGHGGVHHHDGFINVNGIFEGRFDIVLTNPPFGANVEETDVILESDVSVEDDEYARYVADYGSPYKEALARVQAAAEQNKTIASLFTLPKGEKSNVKTEILFIERCLSLLKPGGRLGIVLPEGIFNNPSLAYVREFCEDRAFIRAVISLPQETFYSSGASVKASLLFMQKFTEDEQAQFNKRRKDSEEEIRSRHQTELDRLAVISQQPNAKQADFLEGVKKPTKEQKAEATQKAKDANSKLKELKAKAKKELKALEETIRTEARTLLKSRFPYTIFLYEAEKVGITATGEEDLNELCRHPKDSVPQGIDKTCLELSHEFRQNPDAFLLEETE
jgi:type I restriction enzyme M protein